MRRTFKLVLAYDGTEFVGWQRQAEGVSIQGLIEKALAPIEGAAVSVHGAGRTDAGVHALGQVASFTLTAAIDPSRLARALNAVLPPEVRVLNAEEMPGDFHARFSAKRKIYEYRIISAPVASPFVRRYVWHVTPALDVDAMTTAAAALCGTHDFAAFQGAGTDVASTERTIHRLEWRKGLGAEASAKAALGAEASAKAAPSPDDLLMMEVEGDGFLRHMVRNIAGTLVEVGLGRYAPGEIQRILASRDRALAGVTAPPQGLFLKRVLY
jgi:tRNA pseudouridine38-40 synthase